jgi:hypothetical protein
VTLDVCVRRWRSNRVHAEALASVRRRHDRPDERRLESIGSSTTSRIVLTSGLGRLGVGGWGAVLGETPYCVSLR